jgi:hypothetical protein
VLVGEKYRRAGKWLDLLLHLEFCRFTEDFYSPTVRSGVEGSNFSAKSIYDKHRLFWEGDQQVEELLLAETHKVATLKE